MPFHLTRSRTVRQAAIFSLMIFPPSIGMAAPAMSLGLSAGLEAFRLKEFSSNGSRLVSESGNRFVTTAFLDGKNNSLRDAPFLYHLEAAAYWGQVNYDGQSQSPDPTQSNLPVSSQTDYRGGRAEAMVGYRFMPSIIPQAIEVSGGVGVDAWRRLIHDSTSSNGALVSGIEEVYRVYYGKIALGLPDLLPSSWHSHVQFGVKAPFNIHQEVNLRALGYDNDVSLSPGNAYSGFINLTVEPQSANDKTGNLFFNAYYDGLRFAASKSKTAMQNGSPVQVWQPKTQIDIFGLQIGYRF